MRKFVHGVLIEDMRKLMGERQGWRLQFTFIEANSIAHNLAKLATNL